MKLLLDTHALLWWLSDDDRIGTKVRSMIEEPGNAALVSVVSLWEIAIKLRIGKLRLANGLADVTNAVDGGDFTLLDITAAHLLALMDLPAPHRDPFDHLLMAQAIAEDATFVSDDRHVAFYPVRVIPCSA